MDGIVALEGQSLFDLAIQSCGSIEAVFAIAELNGLSITDELTPGDVLQIPSVINKPVADYYLIHHLKPATDPSGIGDILDDGIGFWAVGVDNVVM